MGAAVPWRGTRPRQEDDADGSTRGTPRVACPHADVGPCRTPGLAGQVALGVLPRGPPSPAAHAPADDVSPGCLLPCSLPSPTDIVSTAEVDELLGHVYKTDHQRVFDLVLFLRPASASHPWDGRASGSSASGASSSGGGASGGFFDGSAGSAASNDKPVCVCVSSKFTSDPSRKLDLKSQVQNSLSKMEATFGEELWQLRKARTLVVVATNHSSVKKEKRAMFLDATEAARTIIVTHSHARTCFRECGALAALLGTGAAAAPVACRPPPAWVMGSESPRGGGGAGDVAAAATGGGMLWGKAAAVVAAEEAVMGTPAMAAVTRVVGRPPHPEARNGERPRRSGGRRRR